MNWKGFISGNGKMRPPSPVDHLQTTENTEPLKISEVLHASLMPFCVIDTFKNWWHCLHIAHMPDRNISKGASALIPIHSFQRSFSPPTLRHCHQTQWWFWQFNKCHRPQVSDGENINLGLIVRRGHCLYCLIPDNCQSAHSCARGLLPL